MQTLYETDRYAWIARQQQLFREGRLDELDTDNLFWEIQAMGSEKRELKNRLITLIQHLLKYVCQVKEINPVLPEPYNCKEWVATIERCRFDINELLESEPHIKTIISENINIAYPKAVKLAVKEMNLYLQSHQYLTQDSFPKDCLWTEEQLLQEDWLPE